MCRYITAGLAVALVACVSLPAVAAEDDWVIEEVVVTAQKREQALSDVSIQVTALSETDLDTYRIQSPIDIARAVPNMDIKETIGGSNPAITIRGVGLNDFNVNNNPSVGVYVDEVFLTSPAMMTFLMYDVDRVEVLRGPQGTLYGRNSNGGAVNIVSRKPTEELDGYIRAEIGDYERRSIQGAIGGSIGKIGLRISGRADERDGYHDWNQGDATFGDVENQSIRAQIGYLGNVFTGNLMLAYGTQKGTTVPGTAFGAQDAAGFVGLPCAPSDIRDFNCVDFEGFRRTSDDPFEHDLDQDAVDKSELLDADSLAAILNLAWAGETWEFRSITAYTDYDRTWAEISMDHDPDITPYGTIEKDEVIDQVSQEFRFSGTASILSYTLGAFYSEDTVDTYNYFDVSNVAPINDPVFGLGGLNAEWGYNQKTEAKALFAHTEWALSERWAIIAGLRWSEETRDFDEAGTTLVTPLDPDFEFPLTSQDESLKTDQVNGKLGLDFRPNDDWLIYGSVATGFKSGGFTGDFTFFQEELEPYDEEEVTAYEVGFKSTLADSKVQLNAALFYYDYQDIQTNVALDTGAFPLTNADKASITGLEGEFFWRPVTGLDIRLGAGWLDHELKDDRLGDKLPNAADLSVTGLIRYEWNMGSALVASIGTDFKYTDDVYRDAFNDPVLKTDSLTLWNAQATLGGAGGHWDLAAWIQNIGDEEYYPQGFNTTALNGTYFRFPGAPRHAGLTLSFYLF
jgi:iron complex outermembrane receptor protein